MPTPSLRSRRAFAALGILALLPAGGCCNLTLLWCGPDKTEWISQSYWTHQEALRTFQEAIRRDAFQETYESLAPVFKAKYGIDAMAAGIAWGRMKAQFPMHLLGSAEVTGPEVLTDGSVRYLLTISCYRFRVDLVREPFVAVYYPRSDGRLTEHSAYLDEPLSTRLQLKTDLQSEVVLTVTGLDLPDEFDTTRISRVVGGHEWKVADLAQIPDQ